MRLFFSVFVPGPIAVHNPVEQIMILHEQYMIIFYALESMSLSALNFSTQNFVNQHTKQRRSGCNQITSCQTLNPLCMSKFPYKSTFLHTYVSMQVFDGRFMSHVISWHLSVRLHNLNFKLKLLIISEIIATNLLIMLPWQILLHVNGSAFTKVWGPKSLSM